LEAFDEIHAICLVAPCCFRSAERPTIVMFFGPVPADEVGPFQNAQQPPSYKPSGTVPAYKPVMPLAPSLSTEQFFVNSISEKALNNPFASFNNPKSAPRIALRDTHRALPIPSDSAPATLFSSGARSTNNFTTGSEHFAASGVHTK
jgi:hypothetical protein